MADEKKVETPVEEVKKEEAKVEEQKAEQKAEQEPKAKAKSAKKALVTNQRANIHYSGDLRLLPGVETEVTAEQLAFIESNEKHLVDAGHIVIKK